MYYLYIDKKRNFQADYISRRSDRGSVCRDLEVLKRIHHLSYAVGFGTIPENRLGCYVGSSFMLGAIVFEQFLSFALRTFSAYI